MPEIVKYNRETLESLTVKMLISIAGKNNIVGRWKMNKEQLIEAILSCYYNNESAEISENENATKVVLSDKEERINNCAIGSIVAFHHINKNGDTFKSAAIIKRCKAEKKLKVKTAYGRTFIINYSDVIWVKTAGKRWPSGVYKLLRGVNA